MFCRAGQRELTVNNGLQDEHDVLARRRTRQVVVRGDQGHAALEFLPEGRRVPDKVAKFLEGVSLEDDLRPRRSEYWLFTGQIRRS